MSFSDKNEKREGTGTRRRGIFHATVADIFIAALIVVVIAGLYAYLFGGIAVGEIDEISYVIRVESVRSELTDRISVGDKVYRVSDGEYMGTVRAYEVQNSSVSEPDKSDLYVTISVSAEVGNDGVCVVSGTKILVSSKEEYIYELRTADFYFEGGCISVTK
ncbi:MAG: DUF4330 domain-containing protein [Firmicutes bacterium]|nr:DUF4330 domain-containing protein [Bacillota bacterium]